MKKIFLSTAVVFFGFIQTANSQTEISLVKDINASTASSNPSEFTALNSTQFIFSAYDDLNGQELWISDGTSSGTVLLKDINPTGDSYPSNFNKIGGKILFTASNGGSNTELWITDGTAAGTTLLKEIEPNTTQGSMPNSFTHFNGKIYFSALTQAEGRELWVTDGTAAGTTLVNDILPGATSADVSGIYEYNNALYFTADKGSYNYQIFKSDGTSLGTTLAFEINTTGSSNSYIQGIFNGKIYLTANNGTNGNEVYISDGTSAGTSLLKDINPTSHANAQAFYNFNGTVFFVASESTTPQLWKTDGTTAGTERVSTINVAPTSNSSVYMEFNNKLYLNGRTSASEVDLYEYNPSNSTLNLFTNSLNVVNINKRLHVIFEGKLYFTGNSQNDGFQLWVTDGTAAGTKIVESNLPTVNNSTANTRIFLIMGDFMYFNGNYNNTLGDELYSLRNVTVGVDAIDELKSFSIYPNPAMDNITVKTAQEQEFEIYTIKGQLVKSFSANNGQQIDIDRLPSGIYLLKTKSSENVIKLIKK